MCREHRRPALALLGPPVILRSFTRAACGSLPTLLPFLPVHQQSKSRLGTVVNKKTATALCLTDVRPGDQSALGKLRETVMNNFNNRFDNINRKWGGGIMGMKTVHKVANFEKQKAKELAARQG